MFLPRLASPASFVTEAAVLIEDTFHRGCDFEILHFVSGTRTTMPIETRRSQIMRTEGAPSAKDGPETKVKHEPTNGS